ncbi:putative peptidoglycan LysM binding protein [Brochothrix thermosphacta]|uniref:muramidase family protein n=1 Tax=Brochothrix thermosphacta TaxID=2756 RepID=UPI00083F5710|nr:LysM peptidoglycan-binding domain-containing protein [Brochothrix thermosphacta]ANZ95982.1 hypothetical protein BFC19_11570 [Brochothrix thermosphacta]ODJ64846.1 hypothetical protein BFR37_02300 [Brochothrix thermosphacta]SPN72147.1 putative peptidoglycan LysM binding protein [Brochothrix thermosphacta]
MKKVTLATGLSVLALSAVITPQAAEASEANTNSYTVKKGDNLYRIAQKLGISVDSLKKINNIEENLIFVGQVLKTTATNQAPQTQAPQAQAPQTQAPQTQAPQTQAPQTQAPQTQAPQTFKPTTTIPSGHTADFAKAMAVAAQKAPSKGQLFTSVLIAQAILESGSGSSGLSANYNNYFGIKGSYQGQTVVLQTQEYVGSKLITINDGFKVYPSPTESIEDYYGLFTKSAWSQNHYSAFINAKNYKDAANALTGKYATDINYGAKLINLIEVYNLQQYDTDVALSSDTKMVTYTVKAGDTLKGIATKYKTSYEKIAENNHLKTPFIIYPNNKLKIEVEKTAAEKAADQKVTDNVPNNTTNTPAASNATANYKVKQGDTLSSIAYANGTTYDKIATLNKIAAPYTIFAGQTVKLPSSKVVTPVKKPATNAKSYTVKSGDTLTKIAAQHGTTWSELQVINKLASPNKLSIGQKITLK